MRIKHSIGILIIVYIGTFFLSCQSELKFDSEKWKNGGGENITMDTRTNMVKDLIESGILLNKNETEIAELIDKPEKLHNRKELRNKYYPVTEKYEWGDIDPKELIYLEIHFNDQGLSNNVKLITTK